MYALDSDMNGLNVDKGTMVHGAICSAVLQAGRFPHVEREACARLFKMTLLRLTSRGAVCLRGSGFMQQRRNKCAFTSVVFEATD
jgi:hypothetical protein